MVREMTPSSIFQVAEVELVYRTKVKPSERPTILCSGDIYKLLEQVWNKDKMELCEEFKIILINRANRVLGIFEVSKGGISSTSADPRLIFTAALKANAVSIILAHNHPSGNLKPSRADEQVTRTVIEIGKYFNIKILDHIIMTAEGYFSFADEGLI